MEIDTNKIRILNGKILVKRKEIETTTATGIVLVVNDKENMRELGEGTVMQGNVELPKGAHIIFNKYSGNDLGDDYVILDPRDVYAVYTR